MDKPIAAIAAVTLCLLCAATRAGDLDVLRRGAGGEAETLDPAKVESLSAGQILNDLFEPLVTLDANGMPQPAAAESWRVSEDGLTYDFHLRSDLRWSDGSPVTAQDFVTAIRRIVDPATGTRYAYICFPMRNAQAIAEGRSKDFNHLGVEAVDPITLRFHLTHPTPYWVSVLALRKFMPIKASQLDGNGNLTTRPQEMISNGAFRLAEWTPRDKIVLVKNPYFHGADTVTLNKVVFYSISSETEEFDRYRAGDLDVTNYFPSQQTELLNRTMASELRADNVLVNSYLGFNLAHPLFKGNPKLRQALSMAIDRKFLVDHVAKVRAPISTSIIPPVPIGAYQPQTADWSGLAPAERIAKAQALFAAAGYGVGKKKLTLEIRTSINEVPLEIAAAISAMWKTNLGVETKIIAEENKLFLDHRHGDANLQIFWFKWGADYPDVTSFLGVFTTQSSANDFHYSNPAFDDLLSQADNARDARARVLLLQKAEALLVGDNAAIPLFTQTRQYLVKPWVQGFRKNAIGNSMDQDVHIVPHI